MIVVNFDGAVCYLPKLEKIKLALTSYTPDEQKINDMMHKIGFIKLMIPTKGFAEYFPKLLKNHDFLFITHMESWFVSYWLEYWCRKKVFAPVLKIPLAIESVDIMRHYKPNPEHDLKINGYIDYCDLNPLVKRVPNLFLLAQYPYCPSYKPLPKVHAVHSWQSIYETTFSPL